MDYREASEIQANYYNATKSGAYLEWNLERLVEVQKQLREARAALIRLSYSVQPCEEALETINASIVSKRAEEVSGRRHRQTRWIAGAGLGLTAIGIVLAQCRGNKQPAMPQPRQTSAETPKLLEQPIVAPSPTPQTTVEPIYSATATPLEKPKTEQSASLSTKL